MGELLFLLAALTPILLIFALLGYLAERWEAFEQRREERLADRHRQGTGRANGAGSRIGSCGTVGAEKALGQAAESDHLHTKAKRRSAV